MASKPFDPFMRSMGVFILLLALLAFAAGYIRNELALILIGAVLLAVLVYCFAAVQVLSLIHRKKAHSLSTRILTKEVSVGTEGMLFCSSGPDWASKRFFRLPGILIRYEVRLFTKDGRLIHHLFDPDFLTKGISSFAVPERGAYYSSADEVAIFDALGLFRRAFRIPQDQSPRLLGVPKAAETAIPVTIRSGGSEQRRAVNYLRTDNLIDHRPYIPGDDPRRINWKLYGHAGDLFVREGEPEPPPHSRLLIMVDTQRDPALYTTEAGRHGVDLLCKNALAAALEYRDRNMDITIGYTGGDLKGGTQAELAAALAYPAALSIRAPEEFPPSPEDLGILILALPRSGSESTALDRFLKKRDAHQQVDIVFLYQGEQFDSAAETCISIYGQKGGVHARRIRL
ncbi:MAG: DUF58 domain-containing protein [Treponema sp.]|nr:DUF58 domain-containing protein [Treponema sp.]